MSQSDIFHAVCIVCTAEQVAAARQGAWDFHVQDSQHFETPVDQMLTVGLSQTGNGAPTHYLCARHASKLELDRMEAYQEKLTANGLPRVPVTLYPSERIIQADRAVDQSIADHESKVLAKLGLQRIA